MTAGLTPFGIEIRKLRLELGIRMLDMAEKLGKSVAFISAVETGRKPIPDGFITEISRALGLSAGQIRQLRSAADKTRKEVRVDKLAYDDRELVAAFARRLDDVPESVRAELRKVVLKSVGDTPFHRQRRGLLVPPMSTAKIRQHAERVRGAFVDKDTIEFPIMDVLEFRAAKVLPNFYLDVQGQDVMGDDEGRVTVGSDALVLREDVYEAAWRGVGRDRFTACHEFAHYLMHRKVTFTRAREDNDKIFCDSEWQADTFAGTLMLSPRHAANFSNSHEAAQACGMSPSAADVMLRKYEKEGL